MVKFICDISRRLLALLLISSLFMAVSATGTVLDESLPIFDCCNI